MRILVSGVAGDIGFGIGKILRNLSFVTHIYGIDVHNNHPGKILFDECYIVPAASNPDYISRLSDLIYKNKIDIFIPSSEAEIELFSSLDKKNISSAKVLLSNSSMVNECLSKHKCLTFLKSVGIKTLRYGLVGSDEPTRYPVIVKPNSGRGSKGIKKIQSKEEFIKLLDNCPDNFVWQQYLYPDDQEYTCAIFKSDGIDFRSLIIKRELSEGFTSKGEVVENMEIKEYIHKIAESFCLDGVMNIQLRLTDDGPIVFEINPRLSSTLVFRHMLGFKDLEWWIQSKTKQKISLYNNPKVGTLFYRGISEHIIKI